MAKWVGQPLRRAEDPRLLTGRGVFVADLALSTPTTFHSKLHWQTLLGPDCFFTNTMMFRHRGQIRYYIPPPTLFLFAPVSSIYPGQNVTASKLRLDAYAFGGSNADLE